MSEKSTGEDEIQVELIGEETESRFGSKTEHKRKPLQPQIETVTPNNWSKYFPDKTLTPDDRREIEAGLWYLRVAIDPQNDAMAGFVEVRRLHDNALYVDVSGEYQRRGVATTLIRQAQADHNSLQLLNYAGLAGKNLYTKMGFKHEGGLDHFVWRKTE